VVDNSGSVTAALMTIIFCGYNWVEEMAEAANFS
jgi:hypothetical protein